LTITKVQLNQILKLIWLGCLASLVFTYVKTPEFEEITFTLKAQFGTTGGHSSNQVSTVLGLGMFLSFYSVFKRLNFSGNRLFDWFILGGFAFQGLLSFSRGGMLVAALGIFILLSLPENSQNRRSVVRSNKHLLIGIIVIFAFYGVFELANNITGGNLLLRYQGHTAGTLLGTKEVTTDHFVSGRIGIFDKDIDLWQNHFFLGVGCGSGRYIRDLEKVGVAAHVELSRLLAEHGLLGLIFALMLFVFLPFRSWQINEDSDSRIILITLMAIALLTTFHAAMRTFVTPLLIILGSLKIKEYGFKAQFKKF
jgi:O-antigen ligase